MEERTCTCRKGSLGIGEGHRRAPGEENVRVTGNRTVRVSQTESQKGGGVGWAGETPSARQPSDQRGQVCFLSSAPHFDFLKPMLPPQSRHLQPQVTEKAKSSQTLEKHQLPVQWNYLLCPTVAAWSPWGLSLLSQH